MFAYNNNSFIVESYLPAESDVKVALTGNFTRLRNLITGEEISAEARAQGFSRWHSRETEKRTTFDLHIPPHSYVAFTAEN